MYLTLVFQNQHFKKKYSINFNNLSKMMIYWKLKVQINIQIPISIQ